MCIYMYTYICIYIHTFVYMHTCPYSFRIVAA